MYPRGGNRGTTAEDTGKGTKQKSLSALSLTVPSLDVEFDKISEGHQASRPSTPQDALAIQEKKKKTGLPLSGRTVVPRNPSRPHLPWMPSLPLFLEDRCRSQPRGCAALALPCSRVKCLLGFGIASSKGNELCPLRNRFNLLSLVV